ncbi:aldolase [Mytilinidion resinicola]|uniref:Fructose-bisphosphate aldolase n=1 Tax=Mytilinidion resinicola TaxID=574789 RepID=A0A6A6YKE6_9PEZI|nr:aldolase [Mytilinidion resinicola]KAF2809018.1 aldolase [Mytilinidion resinicola]
MPIWESDNKTVKILKDAEKGGYGVIAAIVYNLEHILGCIRAAERNRSPLILQVFPWTITFSAGLLVRAAADAASRATTKALVAYCHARGIATEAERGRIEGSEDGIADAADLEGLLTTPEKAGEFLATGVDLLAPAFGNLDYPRLEAIARFAAGRVRIVLHGTNDFDEATMRRCIGLGVSKINVNKLVLDGYLVHLKEKASTLGLTTLVEGVEKVVKLMEWQFEVCYSAGKA